MKTGLIKALTTPLLLIALTACGITGPNQPSGGTAKCGIESCHGLDIQCGPNVPEMCTTEYQLGDGCRQFAKCDLVSGRCQQEKSDKFDQCTACVAKCDADNADPAKKFQCENTCLGGQASNSPEANQPLVGGPCEYVKYKGNCKITSVKKTADSINQTNTAGGPGYEGYEVKYKFEGIEKNISAEDKSLLAQERVLQLDNSWYPGAKFLEKYGIKTGANFTCEIDKITKGTCTPSMVKFDKINLADYSL